MTNHHQLTASLSGNADTDQLETLLKRAVLCLRCEEYPRALQYAEEAHELSQSVENPALHVRCLIQLGLAHTFQGHSEESIEILKHAVEMAQQEGFQQESLRAQVSLGVAYLRQGDYQKVLETQQEALRRAEDINDATAAARAHISLGAVMMQQNDVENAERHLEQALGLIGSEDHILLADIYNQLTELYEKQGSFERALGYCRKQLDAREVVFQQSRQALIDSFEAQIEHLRRVELAAAQAALEEETREQEQFMKIVAHELQNPLASMTMNAGLLQSYFDQLTPEKAKERVSKIFNTAQSMNQIVDNMLKLRMLKQGKAALNIEPVDADRMLRQVVETYRERAEAKSIALRYAASDDQCHVLADRTALKQIIDNLVSNAIKYTPPDKNVSVSAVCNGDRVHVVIQDDGQGLTADDLQNIFKEFTTLSARPTGGERSTGLGLAIVKMMAEAMQGKVWAASDGKDKGSTFTVDLPVAD